jgi:hypothetical protein
VTGHSLVVVVAILGDAETFASFGVAAVVCALVAVVALLGHILADAVLALVRRALIVIVADLGLVRADAVIALALLAWILVFASSIVLAAAGDDVSLAGPCGCLTIILRAPMTISCHK